MLSQESGNSDIQHLAVASLLRESVARRRYLADGGGDLARLARDPLAESIQRVMHTAAVNPHLPIAWPHWPPGVLLKTQAALQKLTRRLLAWYINPIVAQQNVHNIHVLRALQEAEQATRQLSDRVASLERDHQELTEKLAALTRAAGGTSAAAADGPDTSVRSTIVPTR